MTLTCRRIQQITADYYDITWEQIVSSRRARKLAWPRQMAMHLASTLTSLSLPQIGFAFDRDHTTIMHGIAQVEKRISNSDAILHDLLNLENECRMVPKEAPPYEFKVIRSCRGCGEVYVATAPGSRMCPECNVEEAALPAPPQLEAQDKSE